MVKHIARVLGTVVPVVILAACSSPGTVQTLAASQFTVPDPIPSVEALDSYRINAGDQIKITVFNAAALSGQYQVEPSGTISLPLIGAIQVTGRTTPELSKILEQSYGGRYLRDPDISVQLVEYTKSLITISGEVKAPGLIETIGPTNLVQAIARGRGPNETANPRRVVVFRTIGGVRHAAVFDLRRIEAGQDPNPLIYGGDEIIMDGSNLKKAMRDLLSITPILGIWQIIR